MGNLIVFVTLLALTYTTYRVAGLHLGTWNAVLAMLIAATKATLVVLVFMHVWVSSRLTKLIVVASLFWLGILLVLTLADYATRR